MQSETKSNPDSKPADITKERPIRKRRRVQGEKVCQVCGDKALAHHFGALACETCKAFFRRNALKAEETRKCAFSGSCPVDKKTRRFCPPCRLQKCFSVGMQADLILDEDERRERQEKVNSKRAQQAKQEKIVDKDSGCGVNIIGSEMALTKPETCTSVDTGGSSVFVHAEWSGNGTHNPLSPVLPSAQPSGGLAPSAQLSGGQYGSRLVNISQPGGSSPFPVAVKSPDSSVHVGSENLQRLEHVVNISSIIDQCSPRQQSCASPYAASTSASPGMSVYMESPRQSEEGRAYSSPTSTVVARDKGVTPFEHVPREQLPSDPFMYWRLSEEERCLLTKLSSAYQDTMLSILQRNPPKVFMKAEEITTEKYLHECEMEVRSAISFAKRLEDFQRLRLEEQVAVLKASTEHVLAIRSCALYVHEKDAWLTNEGYFTREHCEIICPEHPHLDKASLCCKIVKDIVKNDFTLYALLHCVLLFDPSDERIIDRQTVNLIRDKYVILLRHYLESVYSYRYSEKYLMALQEKLALIKEMSREGRPLIKKFFPCIPNQLLVEVLDLD